MLDQFIRVAFPTVCLPEMWHIRPLCGANKTSLSCLSREGSCLASCEESPVMWDHHDLFGDCLTRPLSWLLQLLKRHQPLKEIRCFL